MKKNRKNLIKKFRSEASEDTSKELLEIVALFFYV